MRRLILCSDDFAFSRGVSETIVELALDGRLNAISCMAVMPGWDADSELLRLLGPGVQLGLHLTLTGEKPLTDLSALVDADGRLPGINRLQRLARLGKVPLDAVAGEVAAQFDRFEAALGRVPDFVDGHQHAHLLPGIRTRVLAETARRAPKAWLRDCTDSPQGIAARPYRWKAVGSALHSAGLAKAAARHGLSLNAGFAGHYSFSGDYARLFPAFLRAPGKTHLVMCHPGAGKVAGDEIAAARIVEAKALKRLAVRDMAADHGLVFSA